MGISPAEAKKMSVWEMAAVTDRWIEAHQTEDQKKGGKLSADEKDEIWDWMKKQPGRPLTLKEARQRKNGAGTG